MLTVERYDILCTQDDSGKKYQLFGGIFIVVLNWKWPGEVWKIWPQELQCLKFSSIWM